MAMTMHMKTKHDGEGVEIEEWMEQQRGGKGDGVLKEEEEEEENGGEVVVSADGWAGGLFCHI